MYLTIFDQLNSLSTTIYVFSILAIILGGGFVVYVKFFYRPKPEEEKFALYEKFDRENVESYIPVEKIKDKVMLMDDGCTYVAALQCKGFDFFYAHPAEQLSTNKNYVDFIQSISNPIQIRMSMKQEDLEKPIADYKIEKMRIDRENIEILEEASMLASTYDSVDEETKKVYAENMLEYDRLSKNLDWESAHLQQIINYMEEISSSNTAPIRECYYIFDWKYDASDFPEGTTDEEIFERAKKELANKAASMKAFLEYCSVRATRATNVELRELARGHFQPYGSEVFKASDIDNSNYDEMITTSNSLLHAKREYEMYCKKMQLYEERKTNLVNLKKDEEMISE